MLENTWMMKGQLSSVKGRWTDRAGEKIVRMWLCHFLADTDLSDPMWNLEIIAVPTPK